GGRVAGAPSGTGSTRPGGNKKSCVTSKRTRGFRHVLLIGVARGLFSGAGCPRQVGIYFKVGDRVSADEARPTRAGPRTGPGGNEKSCVTSKRTRGFRHVLLIGVARGLFSGAGCPRQVGIYFKVVNRVSSDEERLLLAVRGTGPEGLGGSSGLHTVVPDRSGPRRAARNDRPHLPG